MKHVKQIDGLRFIAVFLVLIEHFAFVIGKPISAGYYGVDLFFVISGFLITSILVNTKEPFWASYKKFLGRRTLRIFPLYYLVVFILYCMQQPYIQQYILNFLTYTFNYAWMAKNIPENSATHFWSLSVEEQFYLFCPIIVLLLRKHLNILIIFFTLLVVLCFLQLSCNIIETINPYNFVGLIPRAGSLGMGALGAMLTYTNKLPKTLLHNKVVEYGVFILLAISLIINNPIKYPLLAICSIILVLKAANNSFSISLVNKFLSNNKIVYIGSISYGIYIFHLPLGAYFTEYIFNPYFWNKINFKSMGKFSIIQYYSWLIKFPLYTFLSIILAHYSFNYFEKPILKLKDKLFKYS